MDKEIMNDTDNAVEVTYDNTLPNQIIAIVRMKGFIETKTFYVGIGQHTSEDIYHWTIGVIALHLESRIKAKIKP